MSLSETLEGIREKLTAKNGMTSAFESLKLLGLFIYDILECHFQLTLKWKKCLSEILI